MPSRVAGSPRGNPGFTLVGTMVSFALVGIVALIFAEMMSNQFKAQRGLDVIDGVRDLKNQIQTLLSDSNSCAASLQNQTPSVAYPPGAPIALVKNPAGTTQFSSGGNYESNRVLLASMALHDYIASTSNPLAGIATLTLNMLPVGQTFGAQRFRRDLQLSVTLNATGVILTCSAIGGLSDSLWQVVPSTIGTANQLIYYNAGAVGIGTSSPLAPLQVSGGEAIIDGTSTPAVVSNQTNVDLVLGGRCNAGSATCLEFGRSSATGGNSWVQSFLAGSPVTNSLLLNPLGGKVGVGILNPRGTLHVTGAANGIYFTNNDFVDASQGSGAYLATGAASGNTYTELQAFQSGNGPGGLNNLILQPFGGTVGIGTSSPNAQLDVVGNIQARNSVRITPGALTGPGHGGLIYMGEPGSNHPLGRELVITNSDGAGGPEDEVWIGNNVSGASGAPGYISLAAQNTQVIGNLSVTGCINGTLGNPCVSDLRVKEEIRPFRPGLRALDEIRPVYFRYNGLAGTRKDDRELIGVIAQDVEKEAPELVLTERVKLHPDDTQETEIKKVNYSGLLYVVMNAVKELYALHLEHDRRLQELRKLVCQDHPRETACQ